MKISIVTISFNQCRFIEETINSVLNQKGVDLEYIVVDAGSTDGSREIIEKYKNRIDKVIFESDDGPADGLNKGFAYATGDIYGYLNADDILLPGCLEEVCSYFRYYNDVDVLSGHCHIIDENGNKLLKKFSNQLKHNRFSSKRYTIGYSVLMQQSTFFRSELFKSVGGFDTNYRVMWDAALTVDFIKAKARFRVINKFWSCFRVYSESISGSGVQLSEKGKREYLMLQERIGLSKPVPEWQYPFFRYVGWLLEPNLLLKRIVDGIYSPKRII